MSNNENILKGPGFIAQLKFYDCKSSYGCITACPENAITTGAGTSAQEYVSKH